MSLPPKKYDVFISFRGEDTRTNFTSHLDSALKGSGINTYTDDRLEKGDDVWPGLSSAIKDSAIALVVFSKNYASSKWCLEELLYILECRDRERLVVLPVFYEVDPSDIRKKKGTYGDALFAKHRRELLADKGEQYDVEKKVSEWKYALYKAASISGRDTRNREYKNESEAIQKIVRDVFKMLDSRRFSDEQKAESLVGLHKISAYVKLSQSESSSNQLLKNAQVIGIWGMGGIGKTTIAKALFYQLFHQYDGVCFLENVRESSQNKQTKLNSLREKLLSKLLKDEGDHLKSRTFIQRRLSRKKVFIVLDDVDTPEQLEALCEDYSYAGPGSKLIITTRNKHLLMGKVDEKDIYEIKTWHFNESLELFCLHAFKQSDPKTGYFGLSKRAIDYAKGVPLALKILGSVLHGESTTRWESKLNELKHYPNDRLQSVLQVSYDGLEIPQKEIFLDIAFFFKGENKDFVERILNACGFFATSGLKVLEDKALITISSGMRIQMHDLVQDMGLNIVRQGNKNPGQRSRLSDIEEVSDVLEYTKKGTDAVEGIRLDLSQIDSLSLNINAFSMMTDIRFLKLYIPSGKRPGNMDYPVVLNEFSGRLRYLEWHEYRLTSLPETICTKWLVDIHIPHSHVTELWHGVKNVKNLERLDLSECKHLKNLPDLSEAKKLRWVNLSGCESLAELHPSILSLDPLKTLILDGCQKLSSLKSEKHLKSLEDIRVNGCTSLQEFAVSSDMMFRLDLKNAGVEKLDPLIGRSGKLWWLNLEGLRLQHLPTEISLLKRLEELTISNCGLLVLDKQNLHDLFDGLRFLKLLHLKDCCNLFELPDSISVLSCLGELVLDGSSVQGFPASIKDLTRLEILSLRNCKSLKSLPELPACIRELYAVDCMFLETLSTLKTLATIMTGKKKYISFENCMKLDESSLHRIMEGAQLSAMSATFNNVLVGKVDSWGHGRHNYDFLKVCSPGSSVPDQCRYRSTTDSLTVNLVGGSKLLGLVLFVVLPRSDEIQEHGAKIFFQCCKADGTKSGAAERWHHEAIKELKGDHVYMWYDPILFDNIVTSKRQTVTFKFFVKNAEETGPLNMCIKECGVRLIFDSELPDLLRKLDMDFESKWMLASDLASALRLDLESIRQLRRCL